MAHNPSKFCVHSANIFSPFRNFNLKKFLHSKREALLHSHRGPIVKTVKVRKRLQIGFMFDKLLRSAMQQPDVGVDIGGDLTIKLHHKAKHTMGGRVLRTEVETEIVYSELLFGITAQTDEFISSKLVDVYFAGKL